MTLVHAADLEKFRITPDPNRIYFNAGFRAAVEKVLCTVQQRGRITLLYGESGIGKTTLLSMLQRELRKLHVPISFVSFARVPFDSFLTLCLEDFGLGAEADLNARLGALNKLFASRAESSAPAIIIIDDAQYCSDELFAGLADLLGHGSEQQPGVHLVLSGETALRDRALPSSLAAKIAERVELHRLGRNEIEEYIACRLGSADAPRALFGGETIDKIAAYSQGVPRIINQVCGRALLLAQGANDDGVTLSITKQAIDDYDASKTTNEGQLTREIAALVERARADGPMSTGLGNIVPPPKAVSDPSLPSPPKPAMPEPVAASPKPGPDGARSPTPPSPTAAETAVTVPKDAKPDVIDVTIRNAPEPQRTPRFSGFVPRRRMPIQTVAGETEPHRWGVAPRKSSLPWLRVAAALLLISMALAGGVGVSTKYWPDLLQTIQTKATIAFGSGTTYVQSVVVKIKEHVAALGNRDDRS